MSLKGLAYIKGLRKSFGRVEALKGIDLTIYNGVTGLIGPNGAGKTTLVNIMTGLIKRDSGEVTLFGYDPWYDSKEVRSRLGLLLEDMEIPPRFTARRFIKFLSEIYNTDIEYLYKLIEYFELEGALDREIATYSAGMVKRIMLVYAFANTEAELVILDEPSANLDVGGRLRTISFIKRVKRERNIFVSSHLLPELEEICDYIVLINNGEIIDSNKLTDFYREVRFSEYIVSTSDDDSFKELLDSLSNIDSYRIEGGRIFVKANDPNRAMSEIVELATQHNIKVYQFKPSEDILTRLFRERIYSGEDKIPN